MSNNIHFISAGAGSGKTYSLTQKLQELLSTGKVSPAGVIATTFTNLAAGELKERVRSALIEADHINIANRMEQSAIGTVNSVCGDLLKRFAFEAGMPPDQKILDEVHSETLFFKALEDTISQESALVKKMNATAKRLQIIDQKNKDILWRNEVKKIADAARANNLSPTEIRGFSIGSIESLLNYFPDVSTRDMDKELANAMKRAISGIDISVDTTKKTAGYLNSLRTTLSDLENNNMPWSKWISLTKSAPGKKSEEYGELIAHNAADYEQHPALHADITFFTKTLFDLAATSLDTYQDMKTQKGLIDFTDQEQKLYNLLDNSSVADTLRQELDLLMVDEFQDTSPIQLALFLKLSKLAKQVIWVGDVKQAIYGFRGSDPTLMNAVVKQVIDDGNQLEILPKSWRSRPGLVHYVNALFVPAFAQTLAPEQVTLKPAREDVLDEPVLEVWNLKGKNKTLRAGALVSGVMDLMNTKRMIVDKKTQKPRNIQYGDIAILCRTNSNLAEIAENLAERQIPVKFKRPGLMDTPETILALACLRRLIDPSDTLASAEILTLSTCESPETWLPERLNYLSVPEAVSSRWREDVAGAIKSLKDVRGRLSFLTPMETLRLAIDAGDVRLSIRRWGPNENKTQQRLNNITNLLSHAQSYMDQCQLQNEPATAAGLVFYFRDLSSSGNDAQAAGGSDNAIQLVTHHGSKGLEWPVVIAMDLDTKLKPRLWGLSVTPSQDEISLDTPLQGRSLRYWPRFQGKQSANVPLLETIQEGPEAIRAEIQESEEMRRLLYVSLTRPRDLLILAGQDGKLSGEWSDTLGAEWMWPEGTSLSLPNGQTLRTMVSNFENIEHEPKHPAYKTSWLEYPQSMPERQRRYTSPSSIKPLENARIGETIILGDRLPVQDKYDTAIMGSALHAVIAAKISGSEATQRILEDHGMDKAITVDTANHSAERLLALIQSRFSPIQVFSEHPISYISSSGQVVNGWIDMLIETQEGYILIDHKASPRARGHWPEIALSYSGQLKAYADGIRKTSDKHVLSTWIHFALTGGLVGVL